MSTPETSRFVRLRVDLVLEVEDAAAVTGAALARVAGDAELPAAERSHAEAAVSEDTAEALAYLVDPFDLVGEVPGVELHQASWSSERIVYDPDAPDWEADEDADGDDGYDGDAEYTADDEEYESYDAYGTDDAVDADGADGAHGNGGSTVTPLRAATR
ncbi:hypothetical protein ABZX40_05745 [Streptomyces sp. NPDC004610]|uniref:hypothetical protein n=1 Tax=unclassified Streptomyces TaxID=2593676 RepID=UPI0033A3D56F